MSNTVKTFKQNCTCENCGNEAEMIITCTLEPAHGDSAESAPDVHTEHKDTKQKIKGSGTCSQCGTEADIWVDI